MQFQTLFSLALLFSSVAATPIATQSVHASMFDTPTYKNATLPQTQTGSKATQTLHGSDFATPIHKTRTTTTITSSVNIV